MSNPYTTALEVVETTLRKMPKTVAQSEYKVRALWLTEHLTKAGLTVESDPITGDVCVEVDEETGIVAMKNEDGSIE